MATLFQIGSKFFLLSRGTHNETNFGNCSSDNFIIDANGYFVSVFLATSTKDQSISAISAFLTLATSLQSTIGNVLPSLTADAGPTTDLGRASEIVNAYKAYNTSMQKSTVFNNSIELLAGRNIVQTGFSIVTINISEEPSFLMSDHPFRSASRGILKDMLTGFTELSGFSAAMRAVPQNIERAEWSLIRSNCAELNELFRSKGFTSLEDRAFLLAVHIARLAPHAFQRLECFEGAELVSQMLNMEVLRLIAAPRTGAGRNGIFYQTDIRDRDYARTRRYIE